jgi:hypothetical protein
MPTNPYQPPETEKTRNRRPLQFTIRDLLLSMVLIGGGLTGYPVLFQHEATVSRPLGIFIGLCSPALIGAGIGGPLTGRWGWSALGGIVIQIIVVWTYAILFSGLL